MRWQSTLKKLAVIWLFLSVSFSQGLWPQAQASGDTAIVSRKDYEELKEIMLDLLARYQILLEKVKTLKESSQVLKSQLDDLEIELVNSRKTIESLRIDIEDLKSQLDLSYQISKDLTKRLQTLEKDYETLYKKFLDYQTSAELQLKIEKSKRTWLSWLSGALAALSAVFAGMWAWEKYIVR